MENLDPGDKNGRGWAISFKEGIVKHFYFIVETKGNNSTLQLKDTENSEVQCVRKFFTKLNTHVKNTLFRYDVVSNHQQLMDIVGK